MKGIYSISRLILVPWFAVLSDSILTAYIKMGSQKRFGLRTEHWRLPSEFELQSLYKFHIMSNTLRKVFKTLIPSQWIKQYHYSYSSSRIALALNLLRRLMCHYIIVIIKQDILYNTSLWSCFDDFTLGLLGLLLFYSSRVCHISVS